jgi:ATP-dependent Lon protease
MGSSDNAANVIREFFGGKPSREVPLVPLRDTVVFPRIAVPIVVRREKSLKAIEEAMKKGKVVAFAAQKSEDATDPAADGLYAVATVAKVRELVKQEDGSVRLLVEGIARVRTKQVISSSPYFVARVEPFPEPQTKKTERVEAVMYSVLNQFRRVVNMGANVPFDVLLVILNVSEPWLLGDLVAANMEMKVAEKQEILEADTVDAKLDAVSRALGRQVKLLQMASKISAETGKELDKMQREVFLREQMKSIEKELDHMGGKEGTDELKEKIGKAGMPPEAKEKALKEYDRLKAMPSFSPEISFLRTYLDWLCDLPWDKKDDSVIDIIESKKILDRDHYGLDKVKERILEYLAVQKLVGKIRGPILCFVGPPGTGKTSLGKSIAKALGRKFFRMSLGGVRDEAEIRGHRRTYVGALPGRIIQGIATAKTRNPVFMLDEIDKVGSDAFRGDPSAALLEALDPEQNNTFSDHYLELPFDLSDVLFLTTANVLDTVPPALRDRMEVIEFPGYTEVEKLHIATGYLVPKAQKDNGVDGKQCTFEDDALRGIIRSYTREAGVRNLERQIASVCRKVGRAVAEGKKGTRRVTREDLAEFLGPARFGDTAKEERDEVGAVMGLAWTEAGGEILQIEATKMPGRGNLTLTGHLGTVMQESARAAFSYARSIAKDLGVKDAFYKDSDVHVHVPSGAIPKDGPSAGVAMATALISMLTGRPVRRNVAMTGEVTLRGKALEIGGVKEKVLAAHRAGMETVIMPADNEKDLVDVPPEVRKELKFVFAKHMDDVLAVALAPRHEKGKGGKGKRGKGHARK